MSKVTVAIVTVSTPLPAGITAGILKANITDSNGVVVQAQEVVGSEAVFTGVADGHYTVTVARMDSNGGNLGDAVTATFEVVTAAPADPAPAPVVMYDAPSGVTVTVSAE